MTDFKKILKNVWVNNILWFAGMLVVMLLVRHYIFTPVVVSGKSMDPTMVDRERLIATRFDKAERQDIVTFPAPDEPKKSYIKRVIGLAGDTVRYEKGQLYINDKLVEEPYLKEYQAKLPEGEYLTNVIDSQGNVINTFDLKTLTGQDTKVPKGKLFVMGDNRQHSKDSRMFGFIDEESVTGNVTFSFWPPSKMGAVK